MLPDLNGIEAELDVDSISSRAAASEAAVSVRDFFQPNDTVTCRWVLVCGSGGSGGWIVRGRFRIGPGQPMDHRLGCRLQAWFISRL